jgi:small conductance mechanosensitive channel
MSPAAAQQIPAMSTPPAAALQVRSGFALIGHQFDVWFNDFIFIIPNLVVAFVVALLFVALAWAVATLLHHSITRSGRQDLARMLASFAFWFMLFLGFLVVITILLPSMRPVDIFASLGIGSVALGFAFKDILQNWIAGFFILIRRPFHRGDQIKVGDIEGTVQAVETRATLVKTYSGRLVIIPNGDIYTRSVTVHTAYDYRRTEIIVPVGLEVDLERAMEVFLEATVGVEHVQADPPPDILPWEFSQNNVNIRVRWWTRSQRSYEVRTRAAVIMAIKRASEAAGIALPADTKISFAETPLVVARRSAADESAAGPRRKIEPEITTTTAEMALAKPADEKLDPEAELPKLGELSEGADQVPR